MGPDRGDPGRPLILRRATADDVEALKAVMGLAIDQLLQPFLSAEAVEASRTVMGLDSRLIEDGTYVLVEDQGVVIGCGGWSRRATGYGGDHSPGRDDRLLDPAVEAARIRAMYTHPAHVRRGVGRMILSACETAARAEGFARVELTATLAGEPLYRACGYREIERFEDPRGGAAVPLIRMDKAL